MLRLIFGLLFIVACGHKASSAPPASPSLQEEYARVHLALVMASSSHVGQWPSAVDCDGLLWAGVAAAAGAPVDLTPSLTAEGRPTRRPNADCGPTESKATTSTDMLTGLILGGLSSGQKLVLERLAVYADANSLVVGRPATAVSLSVMKPGTRTALGAAIQKLGGLPSSWSNLPLLPNPARSTDYELHLEHLMFSITKQVGRWSELHQLVAEDNCRQNPDDALALVLCGQFSKAAALVLSPDWTVPHYVRGAPEYDLVHRLYVLHLLGGG